MNSRITTETTKTQYAPQVTLPGGLDLSNGIQCQLTLQADQPSDLMGGG